MSTETFVVMCGGTPLATATTLDSAQAHAAERATRYGAKRELRWDDHDNGFRLMSRAGGKGRFAWTQYWVKAVPTVQLGGAA